MTTRRLDGKYFQEITLTHSLQIVLSSKLGEIIEFHFAKIVKNKQHHLKVLLKSFHLNGQTQGFHPQTQKVQPHLLTHGLTLGVKGLKLVNKGLCVANVKSHTVATYPLRTYIGRSHVRSHVR